MREYAEPLDITDNADLRQLARQVRQTRQPVPLMQNGEVVAVVRPAPRRSAGRRAPAKGKPIPRTDPIFNIIGLGKSLGATDVSEHVDEYLAQAYYEEFHPAREP